MSLRTSIILIAYHADAWLSACIESLVRGSTHRMHLVLVDNSGNTVLHNLDYSNFDIEILKTPRPLGFAEANNYALAHAKRLEHTVLFLNQDTISEDGWVDACLACFEQERSLGAVSPLIRTYEGTGWDPSFLDCLPPGWERSNDGVAGKEPVKWFRTDHAPAPALFVRTDVLRKIGPFDPVFGSYYEDYDLCLRVRNAGFYIAFCESGLIRHYSGSSTTTRERELKRMRQIIRNRVIYRLRSSNASRPLMTIRFFFNDLPRRVLRGIFNTPSSQPPAVTLKAYADLLGILGRLVSRRKDEASWQSYLEELGWPHQIAGLNVSD